MIPVRMIDEARIMKLLRPSRVRAAGPPKNPLLVSIADVVDRVVGCRMSVDAGRDLQEG